MTAEDLYPICLRSHASRSAWIVSKGFGCHGNWRSRRVNPWDAIKVKELQQVWLCGIAGSQMRATADKPVLNKLDYRCVVHRCVRNIVPSRERRDDYVWQAETELCCKSLVGRGVSSVGAGVSSCEVAMECWNSAGWYSWNVSIGIHADLRDVGDRSQRGIGVVI